ncbi:Elongator complex protein 2 [Beauveria bassiana D1-5]|uniref:Elongator complex protein 2 n=1 Tax=Beauveria bassiana D1-5 TaxID=1245745 RepID=A0A0A2V9X7_BEABA|nr:Elongator complex protein 2 [Beauveria bassiana D1-5]
MQFSGRFPLPPAPPQGFRTRESLKNTLPTVERRDKQDVIATLQLIRLLALELPVCIIDEDQDARSSSLTEKMAFQDEELTSGVIHDVLAEVVDQIRESAYLSAGANRQTAVADWSRGGLLAFGADTNVAFWAPEDDTQRGISGLLSGHGDVVKAVTFLPEADGDEASYLISGANDKSLIIWKSTPDQSKFELLHTSHDHAGAVNCIAAIRLTSQPAKWLIASGAADATMHIWSFESDKLELLQTIKTTPKFFPLSLALSWLSDDANVLILSAAGTKDSIQILTAEAKANAIQFQVQATLRGHEGWIRSLSFARESSSSGSDLLLASASQDKYVRIWRFHQGKELPAATADGADPSNGAYMPGKSPSNKAHWIKAAGQDFSVTFEALLLGHEDWIYSARWHTRTDGTLQLLSTSADNSLAIWEADPTSGIWVSAVRLGEISREKGATTATGSTGGFWTGLWSPDGTSVACLGRTGSWRRWVHDAAEDTWRPCVAVSGHTKAVTGIAWSKGGEYLLSTSLDQTTRLHTKWTSLHQRHAVCVGRRREADARL